MDLFNLKNIVNQEKYKCESNIAYNLLSQTNASEYHINDEMGNLCKCTYEDVTDPLDIKCPAGKTPGTFYPLLNKVECCESCPYDTIQIPQCKYEHTANKLTPVHYDYALNFQNPNFINQLDAGIIPKTSIPIVNTEKFENQDSLMNIQPIIIEPIPTQDQKCICRTIYDNINYVIVSGLLVIFILALLIIIKSKYFKK